MNSFRFQTRNLSFLAHNNTNSRPHVKCNQTINLPCGPGFLDRPKSRGSNRKLPLRLDIRPNGALGFEFWAGFYYRLGYRHIASSRDFDVGSVGLDN